MTAFGKRLKAARKKAGFISARSFAEALGVEQNRYRHWERGTAAPDLTMLTRICRLLDIEPNDLLPMAVKKRSREGSHGMAA